MKIRTLIFSSLLLALPLPALAIDDTPSIPSDSRIKVLVYDDSDVYTIVTKYGYQTNIVFAPSEEIQTISVGDRSLWQIIPSENRIFIRPMEDNVITNMTVLTDRRSYQFDLKSVAADNDTNIYVAKFIYPGKRAKMEEYEPTSLPPIAAMPQPSFAESPATASPSTYSVPPKAIAGPGITEPVNPNYNYSFSGADELAPVQVYDDGKSTYIKYKNPYQPLPNAYMVAPDGTEHLTTVYQRDKVMMIDAVAAQWVLRNSNGAIVVYNEMMKPR